MTILYKVQNNEYIKDGVIPQKCGGCQLSAKNIAAFFSLNTENSHCYRSEVYVCDISSPWQHFKVCSSKTVVSFVEWNYNGELLLIGYKGGYVEIWATRHKLINSWLLLFRVNFPCEDIVNCKFFQNGKSLYFNAQKKDMLLYAEKFERLDYRPTAEGFGGTPVEGCIVLTASGLLGVFVIPNLAANIDISSSQHCIEIMAVKHSLGLSRNLITYCSMCYSSSGSFNIAVSCGSQRKIIQYFKVNINLDGVNVLIHCESVSNLFLNTDEKKKMCCIACTATNSEDLIYIAYNGLDGSVLEQWNLIKKPQAVHKLLQRSKGEFKQCESWECIGKFHFTTEVSHICLSKMFSDQIFVILKYSVQVLDRGLKKNGFIMFEGLCDDRQIGCKFILADVSVLNQILLVFDDYAQIYAMQVPHLQFDKSLKHNLISLQVSLLEYCLITGVDASDLLLLNLFNLDTIIEKLTDNFTRQPAFTRHYYYSNFLSLKSNMCRVQSKQQDFDNLILLHSISITFKGLLRPSDLGCQDKGPAENLTIILSEPLSDVDKVLFNLDAKDFTVEPLTLQSLQQLIQWVADLALNILKKLPDEVTKSKLNKKQGYDISRDVVAIGSIRELLVMIRIWGLLNSQCLPIYMKSVENVDVLAIIFRLLTRLAQNTSEPDDMLLDECSILSTQILIPPRQTRNPTTLLNCHLTIIKPYPFKFTTAIEPMVLEDIQFEEVVFIGSTKDGISNLHLGSRVSPVKKCIRCGFLNSLNKIAKTTALKAWCHRWLYCHCGGYWKM